MAGCCQPDVGVPGGASALSRVDTPVGDGKGHLRARSSAAVHTPVGTLGGHGMAACSFGQPFWLEEAFPSPTHLRPSVPIVSAATKVSSATSSLCVLFSSSTALISVATLGLLNLQVNRQQPMPVKVHICLTRTKVFSHQFIIHRRVDTALCVGSCSR